MTTKTAPDLAVKRMALALSALGDPVRLQALLLLAEAGGDRMHVGGLCEALDVKQSGLSHSLRVLRYEGMADCERDGHRSMYFLTARGRDFVDGIRPLIERGDE